jgi:hypothetical protein
MAAAAINSRVWGRSFLAGFFIGVPRPSMAYGSIASMKFPAPIQAYEHAEKASGCVLAPVGPSHVIPTYALGFELLPLGGKVFE